MKRKHLISFLLALTMTVGCTMPGTVNAATDANGNSKAQTTTQEVSEANVTLSSVNKSEVIAAISQDKTEWLYDNHTEGKGTITADTISAGKEKGTTDHETQLRAFIPNKQCRYPSLIRLNHYI